MSSENIHINSALHSLKIFFQKKVSSLLKVFIVCRRASATFIADCHKYSNSNEIKFNNLFFFHFLVLVVFFWRVARLQKYKTKSNYFNVAHSLLKILLTKVITSCVYCVNFFPFSLSSKINSFYIAVDVHLLGCWENGNKFFRDRLLSVNMLGPKF